MSDRLFDMEPIVAIADPVETLSADRRRTLRQKTDVARGIHPLTRRRVHDDPARSCGDCLWRRPYLHRGGTFPKCWAFEGARITHSATSDVRAWWPGCTDHEWGDPKLSADAARWVPEVAP